MTLSVLNKVTLEANRLALLSLSIMKFYFKKKKKRCGSDGLLCSRLALDQPNKAFNYLISKRIDIAIIDK